MNACTVMKLRGNYARMFNEDFFFGRFSKISKLDFWRIFLPFSLKTALFFYERMYSHEIAGKLCADV